MKETESQTKLSLKLQAYQYLKTRILNCEYRPNEFLNEQKLCAEMGNISRTPMRDALGRLEQEGLITILPKKGLMVSGITEEDVHSMFEMRLLVEPYALRTYGSSIPREQLEAFAELMHHPDRITDFCESDDAFHELLMSTLPNKYLRSAYDRITGLNTRFRIMTGKVSMINQEQTCEEHLEILDAALADNWDTVEGIVFDHKSETPGLGAEIATPAHQALYKGKTLFEKGDFVSITLRKGGAKDPAHEVDAVTGGTKTSDGVTAMLRDNLSEYLPFFEKARTAASAAGAEESNDQKVESNE